MIDHQETLRRLALSDERFAEAVLRIGLDTVEAAHLDQKTHALVRLGAAFAVDAAPTSYHSCVDMAIVAGASVDEIVATLITIAPVVGLSRVVSAAPEIALALGCDGDPPLEPRSAEME